MTRIRPEWFDWPETQKLTAAFETANAPLRFVGGAVRDALLNRPVKDVDAATPLLPDAVMALLEKAHIRALPTGIAHGTVTAVIDKKHFEITTLRRDVDTDGRHATVAYTDDWQEDAKRRDFTMNALYFSPQGELFDYFGGAEDAKAVQVRFIGDASARIREDYLRILRFFRFYAWFGQGEPDISAMHACEAAANRLNTLSGERIQQETLKLLAAPHSASALRHMQHARILDAALAITAEPVAIVEKLEELSSVEPIVKLAALVGSYDHIAPLQARLKLSKADTERLQDLLRYTIPPDASPPGQKKLLRKYGPDLFVQLVQLSRARAARPNPAFDHMLKLVDLWQPPLFPLTGDDLIALGMQPGKEMGKVLKTLEDWWEEADYRPDKAALLERARQDRQ